jgi:hypothetical protein
MFTPALQRHSFGSMAPCDLVAAELRFCCRDPKRGVKPRVKAALSTTAPPGCHNARLKPPDRRRMECGLIARHWLRSWH